MEKEGFSRDRRRGKSDILWEMSRAPSLTQTVSGPTDRMTSLKRRLSRAVSRSHGAQLSHLDSITQAQLSIFRLGVFLEWRR